jgi:hypothetical protein
MARGTWQGSGTWQTSGPGLGPLAAAAGIAVVVIGALEWLLARIWWLIGGTAVLAAAAIAAYIALARWTDRREARFADRRRTELAAQAAAELPHRPRPAAVEAAPQPPAIVNHYHGPQITIYGRDGEEAAARIIRQALPGTAGEAITEGKPQP